MASIRTTGGAILGTVQTVATVATSTIDSVGKAVGMLDVYVTEAATKQRKESRLDLETFDSVLLARKAEEEMERNLHIQSVCSRSPEHERLYKEAYDRFAKVLAAA
jgi:hypothetical protein